MSSTYAKSLADVLTLWDDEKYDRALKRIEEMRKQWPGNPHLLVLAARLIQLQDEPTQTLNDAKRLIQQAIELDKQSPEAAIEFGYFLDAVDDDPTSASKAFAQGISAARQLLIEGLLGQTHSLLELEERDEAVRCLVEALHHADAEKPAVKKKYSERIEELLKELGQLQTA
jgi:predicted Zn-dependent protease